jgi:hypothetical protein
MMAKYTDKSYNISEAYVELRLAYDGARFDDERPKPQDSPIAPGEARALAATCGNMARAVGSVIGEMESRLEAAGQDELIAELAEYLSKCLSGNGADGRDSDGDTD